MSSHPKNVGVIALDIYFPPSCILQEVSDVHDVVSKGKYAIGLGIRLCGILFRGRTCHLIKGHAEGPAQPTGGAAAVATSIGPDAPFAFES